MKPKHGAEHSTKGIKKGTSTTHNTNGCSGSFNKMKSSGDGGSDGTMNKGKKMMDSDMDGN